MPLNLLNFSPWVNLTDQALSWSVYKSILISHWGKVLKIIMSYGIELECHVIVRKVINLDILKYAFALFGVGLGTPLSLIKSNFWIYFLLCRVVNHPENWKCSFSSK